MSGPLGITCSQCQTQDYELAHPRYVRGPVDQARLLAAGVVVDGDGDKAVAWVVRISCQCQWRARVRQVHNDLLPLLLPDPAAQGEIRRRGR